MDILKAIKKRRAAYRKELKTLKSQEFRETITSTNLEMFVGVRIKVLNVLIKEFNDLIRLFDVPIK